MDLFEELLADYAYLRNGEHPVNTKDRDQLVRQVKRRLRRMEASHERLLAFVSRWRGIIDGGAKSAEGWSREFDGEAATAISEAEAVEKTHA